MVDWIMSNMLAWLKRLLGFPPSRIDPQVFGPFANGVLALQAADAEAVRLKIANPIFEHTAGTPSMVPLIPAAVTILLVAPCACDDRLLGRIVTVQVPGDSSRQRSHRVVGKFGNGTYVLRGDANAVNDPIGVNAFNLVGEVLGIYLFNS